MWQHQFAQSPLPAVRGGDGDGEGGEEGGGVLRGEEGFWTVAWEEGEWGGA